METYKEYALVQMPGGFIPYRYHFRNLDEAIETKIFYENNKRDLKGNEYNYWYVVERDVTDWKKL